MSKEDDEKMAARRTGIFKAGADAAEPAVPEELGSMERCTWYDGHASTHPEFKNPYRQRK